MPQLNTATYFSTILWTWLGIGIVYILIAKVLIPNKYKLYEYRKEMII